MFQIHNGRLLADFTRDPAESYLVIQCGAHEKIFNGQLEMIAHNRIPGVLPMDARRLDDKICFYCMITSKIPLSGYLERRKLKQMEFIRIMDGIAGALSNCRDYFLKDDGFILEEEAIYINPATLEVFMPYIPIQTEYGARDRLKELAMALMMHSVDWEEGCEDNFLQKVLGCVKSEAFSIGGFYRLLHTLDGKSPPVFDRNTGGTKDEGVPADGTHLKNGFAENKAEREVLAAEDTDGAGTGKINKSTVMIVLTQVALAALMFAAVKYMKGSGTWPTANYAGVGLIFIAMDILLCKNLFLKEGFRVFEAEGVSSASGDIAAIGCDGIPPEYPEGMSKHGDGKEYENSKPIRTKDRRCDTVFLAQPGDPHPYLLGDQEDENTKVSIDKDDYIIGRLDGQVDHVCGSIAVGKIHARIITRSGKHFLTDLNSKNGTFINDVRIDSNKEYEIRHSDRIMLANCSYTFIAPKHVIPDLPEPQNA